MAELEKRLAKLTLELLPSLGAGHTPELLGFPKGQLEVPFNPTEYSIDRETTFAEVAIPGLDAPVLQYVRGNGDRMTFELFLDVTDTMKNGQVETGLSVRDLFVDPLQHLLIQHEKLHAPPPVRVLWGNTVVLQSAVATALSVKYTLFDSEGLPVRATANLTLREHHSAADQLGDRRLESPDLTNVATVREGDTLPAIAFREYGDARQWRQIGIANDISNPLALTPGEQIVVPKIL